MDTPNTVSLQWDFNRKNQLEKYLCYALILSEHFFSSALLVHHIAELTCLIIIMAP